MSPLADSDLIIQHLRRISAATERLLRSRQEGLAVSIVTVAELYEGVHASPAPEQTEADLWRLLNAGIAILPVDRQVCRIFGEQRWKLRRAGKLIGDMDLLIGSTALRHGLTILTKNRRHFERIEGLLIESW
ncbi:MAG: type II toxin-antitoxin system VapC family toxin [Chloroflexi bacterium]|nr:type II toxin-antitoxin system VapC family toxin [Chloroflexota bacterium]